LLIKEQKCGQREDAFPRLLVRVKIMSGDMITIY